MKDAETPSGLPPEAPAFDIKGFLAQLPHLPGVYRHIDADDVVLYVGKANSIKDRVGSYFQNYKKDWKISALLDEHARIDFILTKNESEALLLEAKLIQEHKPKFNVLLKEGQPEA